MIINAAKATEAAGILGVELSTLNPDLLSAAYRTKAREHHPDSASSYDPEAWGRVSWAKEVLIRWLEQKPATPVTERAHDAVGDCRSCAGTGRVAVTKPKGFGAKPVTMMCVMCNGSGSQPQGGAAAYTGD